MEKLYILTFILPFNLLANINFIIEPMTWDELQLYQLDSLLDENKLNLSIVCPLSLKSLKETHTKPVALRNTF